jgi:hypothetical protein
MNSWNDGIETAHPCWNGYRGLLETLSGQTFPGPDILSDALPGQAVSAGGEPIRFVPAADLPGVDYEPCIYRTGRVSTREENRHDLFNALVWCRFPRLKSALNALHVEHMDDAGPGRRGQLRDAVTLLDESGMIVAGSDLNLLQALARRDWSNAFVAHRASWSENLHVFVCGHAVLEKFLAPYKSITAHALLLHCPRRVPAEDLDRSLAAFLGQTGRFRSTADLSPLPLMGIPGWWTGGAQGLSFYADETVFRPPPENRPPAPVHSLT